MIYETAAGHKLGKEILKMSSPTLEYVQIPQMAEHVLTTANSD